jgi:hypothetical protein
MFGKVTKTHEHAGEFGGLPNQAMTPTSRAHLSCEPPIPVMEKSQQSSGRAKIIHHYSPTLLLIVQHYLRHRLAGNHYRAETTRDFHSRHLDTLLPNFVVLWQ